MPLMGGRSGRVDPNWIELEILFDFQIGSGQFQNPNELYPQSSDPISFNSLIKKKKKLVSFIQLHYTQPVLINKPNPQFKIWQTE